mgnify:CR=1 FL=1
MRLWLKGERYPIRRLPRSTYYCAGHSGGGTSGDIQCPYYYTSFGEAGYSGGR